MPVRPTPLLVTALLCAVAASGCLGSGDPAPREHPPADVGYDPTMLRVSGHRVENHTVRSSDGATDLAVTSYIPVAADLPDGPARFPLVVFLHGWGGSRSAYTGESTTAPAEGGAAASDRLARFADAGILAVAYDMRGFGDSGGSTTVAGPAELADLGHVLEWARQRYPTNGRAGLVGQSYGAGQALLAMVRDPGIDAVVAMYGWADLAEGLIPGDVPKLEWGNVLVGGGAIGSKARYDPLILDWYAQAYVRDDLDRVRAQMGERSAGTALASARTPLLLCQGLEESLFPQQHAIAQLAGGFTRSYYFTGGHGADDAGCWDRAEDWMQYFLGGFDTQVDSWPALDTSDANGVDRFTYATWPRPAATTYRLRGTELSTGPPSQATFTVTQRFVAAPAVPDVAQDQSGLPRPLLPAGARQDPGALFFATPPVEGTPTVAGAATLTLVPVEGVELPFQVVGTLYRVTGTGQAQVLGRGAVAALDGASLADGPLTMHFPWVHARLQPGDRLELKLAANDASAYFPLVANYAASFTGASELALPILPA